MDNKKIVLTIIAVGFLIAVGVVAFDMARQTTSPWNKAKFDEKYRVK